MEIANEDRLTVPEITKLTKLITFYRATLETEYVDKDIVDQIMNHFLDWLIMSTDEAWSIRHDIEKKVMDTDQLKSKLKDLTDSIKNPK